MLATTLIVALFLALIAVVLLIALIAVNLGLYLWEWLDTRRRNRVRNPANGGDI